MNQLDLFGSFVKTPAEEEKTGSTQPVLKSPTDAHFASDKPANSAAKVNENLPEEYFKEAVQTGENIKQDLPVESPSQSESFLLPNTDIKHSAILLTAEATRTEADVVEFENIQPVTLSKPNEPKQNDFYNNEEATHAQQKTEGDEQKELADNNENKKDDEKKQPQKRGRKPLNKIEAEADLIEVPEDEVLFQKQYYQISEVAKWFRVNASLLRFWEKEFDILKPKKNRKGDRLFRPEDVKNLQLIYHLLRQRKYTIEGAKEYIKTNKKKADIEMELVAALQKFRTFLLDLKVNLHNPNQ